MNGKRLNVAMTALAGLALTALGGCSKSGGDKAIESSAEKVAVQNCMQVAGSQKLCECTVKKMHDHLSAAEYAQWAKIKLATQDATSLEDAAKKTGMSLDQITTLNTKFTQAGQQAGMECAGEMGGNG